MKSQRVISSSEQASSEILAIKKRNSIKPRNFNKVKKIEIPSLILKYSLAIVGLFCVSRFEIANIRLSGGAFLSLLFCGLNPLVCAVAYLTFAVIVESNIPSLIAVSILCVVGTVGSYFARGKHAKAITAAVAFACQLGQFSHLFFYYGLDIVTILLNAVMNVGFMYVCSIGLKPLLVSSLKFKLLESELVCLGLIIGVCGFGLSSLSIFGFLPLYFVAAFATLSALFVGGKGASLSVVAAIGVGAAAQSFDVSALSVLVFTALISGIFLKANKFFAFLASNLAFVMFTYFFDIGTNGFPFALLSYFCGGVIFCCFPSRVVFGIKNFLFASHSKVAARYLINRNKEEFRLATEKSGDIFRDMGEMLAAINSSEAIDSGLVEREVCLGCDNRSNCKVSELEKAKLSQVAAENKSVGLGDFSGDIVNSCQRLSRLLSGCNAISLRYNEQKQRHYVENMSRKMIASELSEVSEIVVKLGNSAATINKYDFELERRVIDELSYSGIVATEALISGDVTVILRSENFDKSAIEKAVSAALKCSYIVSCRDETIIAGFSIVTLVNPPKFDLVFSSLLLPKINDQPCGDISGVIKINKDKLLFALSDGMGSGLKANQNSNRAISLVESFYSAGFSSEFAMNKVNKFLSATGTNDFSAMDICVFDLNIGCVDIIKFASPACYIKRKDTIEKIDGATLPFGALEEATPLVEKRRLVGGEIIILVSDGVSDCFPGDELSLFLNNIDSAIPEKFVEKTIAEVKKRANNSLKDDSSILVARFFARS